jgi:CPA1 family monovalent cation:H+ antiporter
VTTVATFVILFSVASAVAVAVRRLPIPYTVALVLVGLGLGSLHAVEPTHLTKELLFTVFLPGLLFEAAFHLDSKVFRRMWVAITALAIPGVIAAIGITAVVLTVTFRGLGIVRDFSWGTALVFAALIAATDPVAVTALFRRLSAPKDLLVLIEGESLLNDGTAIVFLSLILAYVTGTPTTSVSLAAEFLLVAGGGALIGLASGALAIQTIRRIDDQVVEITLTTITAYGSFVFAESLHVSGVIATVVAGMLCGNNSHYAMSPKTHAAVEVFWEYVAFALNSIVFLLIGFDVSIATLLASWREIIIAYLAIIVARGMIVSSGNYIWQLARRGQGHGIPFSWSLVLIWGGLRGALSMVLALALGAEVANRELIVTMTAGVVLLTLLVQGLTMAPLVRRLDGNEERQNSWQRGQVTKHG